MQPFVEYRGDDWRDIVDQNLTMAALCARAEAEVLLDQGEGGVHPLRVVGGDDPPVAR